MIPSLKIIQYNKYDVYSTTLFVSVHITWQYIKPIYRNITVSWKRFIRCIEREMADGVCTVEKEEGKEYA